jgi:transposase InsO family protein
MEILDRYPENFRPPGPDPCKLGIYRITLKDKSKFHVALPRRVNPIMLAEIRRQVEELVAQGAIERCTSRPASIYAIVMARRPNAPGKYRLCVDLVEGNSNTVPMPYAIPEVQQALDRLSGKALYSSFDFSSWFHQFEIAEEDRDKVAFIVPGDNLTPPQIYRYKRVAFGLMNATYFCQRQLQEALEEWPGCAGIFPFVDDIVIAADTLEEMLEKLDSFMRFCAHHNIRLKKEKTELVTTAVKHVGFIISKEGQSLDPARVDSLLNIGTPKDITGLKSLLGSFGFIRNWLADAAGTCAPLTDLMSGTAHRLKLDWGPVQDAALAALKLNVELAPAKLAPDYSLPFHVYVDASDVGVAAVLIQYRYNDAGELLPFAISHQSRRWAAREAQWEISVREMYAIRYGLFKFREYLQGCPNVTVWSDHLNLVNGLWQHSSPKIQRWRLFLESMRPFYLKHVSGTDRMQLAADSLSRLHIENLCKIQTTEELDPLTQRMMARGEGEDDIQMFGEDYSASASTQTDCLADIHVHNARCAFSELQSPEERQLEALYGKGYKISIRKGAASASTILEPLQPLAAQKNRRSGIGFDNSYASHKFRKISDHSGTKSLSISSNISACDFTGSPAPAPTADCIESISGELDLWDPEEGDRTSMPCISSHATFSSESQTMPQDYMDLARHRAGGLTFTELLKSAHDDTHPGFICTYKRVIKALGPRPGEATAWIKDEVKRHCSACPVCQKIKPAREKIFANAGTIRSRPFSSYAFDVVTLSDPDADGNRYILVCVDSWSRALELFPLKQANSTEVFQCLNDLLCRWGTPHELRCDNAKAFTAAIVRALLSRSHVKMHLTAPYSHQSNGQVENCNRRVMDVLRALVIDDRLGVNTHTKWSLLLPQVRRIIMTRTVLQHGCTPNDLAYMNCPETESSIFANEPWMPPSDPLRDEPSWVAKLAAQHQTLINICDEKQDQLFQKLAEKRDPAGAHRSIFVGDFVFVKMEERKHTKIQAPWAGPYQVIDFPANDPESPMALLQHLSTKKTGLFHKNMLKFCDMTGLQAIEDAIPYAAKDLFEYEVAEVLQHRPAGPRKIAGKLIPKSDYEFRCLWKDLVEDEANPSWEPWSNATLRECEAYKEYLLRPDIIRELGSNF